MKANRKQIGFRLLSKLLRPMVLQCKTPVPSRKYLLTLTYRLALPNARATASGR
jgi:hypothetical protein